MATRFLAGKEYGHLCSKCQAAIDLCAEVVLEGPDTDNIEAPFDFAADHLLLCGGRTCAGGFAPGQICHWKGMYYDTAVKLEGFHKTGGFWLARDRDGREVCPDAEDLRVISEASAPSLRHAAHMMQMRQVGLCGE